jgi:putative transposase
MDGRGRWMDNVFIERLWRSLKYECVFLNVFETGSEAQFRIARWIGYYNAERPHSALAGRTPGDSPCRILTEIELNHPLVEQPSTIYS